MADETETVRVVLDADVRRYIDGMNRAGRETREVDRASKSLKASMVEMGKGFGVAAAAAIATQQLQKSVTMAIDLQDNISKVGVIFGDAADDIEAFADDTTKSFGLTKTAALEAASTFAIFGKAAGLTGGDLTKFSTELTQRAVDLKSFFGGDVQQAIGAIGSALRGEAEPIRAYGVLLDDATLRARALTMGLVDSVKEGLTPQTRALAAAQEIMAQTSDANGDYLRTQDGAANSIQNFNVALGRLQETAGTTLLPMVTDIANGLTTLTNALGKASEAADVFSFGMFKIGTFAWWQNIPFGDILGFGDDTEQAAVKTGALADAAATASVDVSALGGSASGAAGGVDALGTAAGATQGHVEAMTGAVGKAISELNGFIDARQGLLGAQRDMLGIGEGIRNAMRQPGARGGGGGGEGKASEAETKARQKVIDKIREQDQAEVELEIKRARRRAQRKADAAADAGARADTQAGVAGAIAADKKARTGADLTPEEKGAARGTVGEATGSLSKGQQKKLDKEIEGIRARHKKALDAQLKGLEGAQKASQGAAASTDTYSTSLDENTAAGRRNLDQLDVGVNLIQSIGQAAYDEAIRQNKGVEEAARIQAAAMATAREDLIDQYERWGFSRKAVEAYIDTVGLIPKKIETLLTIKVDDGALDAAVKKWGPGPGKVYNPTLGAYVKGKPGDFDNKPKPTAPATPASGYPANRANQGAGRAPTPASATSPYPAARRAGGGEISGPGGPRSDSVPIWASAGEFMVNAQQYAANRELVKAINAGSGQVSSGLSIGSVTVNESSPSRVRASVIDGLAEQAYRTGVVR